jgi:hypothetical protein
MDTAKFYSMQGAIAIIVTIGFLFILYHLLTNGLPAQGSEPMLIMLGSLGTAWTGITGYYFGSSMGSRAKSDVINTIVSSGPAVAPSSPTPVSPDKAAPAVAPPVQNP